MTQKELRKLKRTELQDMLLEQESVIEKLQIRVEELETQLADRSVKIEQAGNLADATLQINGVFEAAQKAAQQYLDNIKSLSERQTAICQQQEEECKARCRSLMIQTKQKCEDLERETESKVNARWNEFSQKVEQYLAVHGELQEVLKSTIKVNEKTN